MALISGAVNITGTIAPTDTNDIYATHDSKYGKGGYREVADLLERNDITLARRSDGMLVYVRSEDKIFKLENGLENSNWVEFNIKSSQVEYDNSGSVLSSSNIQDAVDEVAETTHQFTTKQVTHQVTGGATGSITVIQGDDVLINTELKYAENDFSVGPTEKTAAQHSFVTGKYNVAKDTSILEVGIGADADNKQNAFEVSESGIVSAPSASRYEITEDGDLTTKNYIDWLVIDCGDYDE
jgi:hypothetical protein